MSILLLISCRFGQRFDQIPDFVALLRRQCEEVLERQPITNTRSQIAKELFDPTISDPFSTIATGRSTLDQPSRDHSLIQRQNPGTAASVVKTVWKNGAPGRAGEAVPAGTFNFAIHLRRRRLHRETARSLRQDVSPTTG